MSIAWAAIRPVLVRVAINTLRSNKEDRVADLIEEAMAAHAAGKRIDDSMATALGQWATTGSLPTIAEIDTETKDVQARIDDPKDVSEPTAAGGDAGGDGEAPPT